ncbi:hypothetical protein OSTOST_15446 [Ostertagia ostertagi]
MSTGSRESAKKLSKEGSHHTSRFNASVLMLSSLGFAQVVAQWIVVKATLLIAQLLILILCAFSHEWNFIHGDALTRHRRTHFNVANPEPPTPGDVAVTHSSEKESKKTAFTDQRDAHYAGMFTIAMQRNKEMEMMRSACSSLDVAQLQNVELKPADPEQDKKEHEEKKKKETEEYLKQFDKPFTWTYM